MCIEALNNKINILEIRVKTIEQKLEHANLDPQLCFDQFKILKDNNVVIEEMVKSTLDYLAGLGEFLKYRPNTHSEKELGYGKKESNKSGEKKDE